MLSGQTRSANRVADTGRRGASSSVLNVELSPASGDALAFDPALGKGASRYWVLELEDGRVVDAANEMVFESLEGFVAATFVAEVRVRKGAA